MSIVIDKKINRKQQPSASSDGATTHPSISQRGVAVIPDTIPEKVYIERRPEYEYTDLEPARMERLYRLLDGYYGQSNFLELFHCLPEIFAPIHEIASRVADANWELRRTWNNEIDYKDENFNRLFSAPNPFMNIKQLVYTSVCYYLLTGRLFWSKNQPSTLEQTYQNILSWFVLPSHQVWVDQAKQIDPYTCTALEDIIKSFQLRDGVTGIKGRAFETNQVMPMVNFSLKQLYDYNKNNSPLLGAEKAIKNLIPVYEARGTIYIKRGALGFIVSRKADDSGSVALNSAEMQQLHRDYQETYGVTSNKNNIGITGQPIDFVPIGMNIKELQPFDETLSDAIAIYATLRVPRHLVPGKDAGTFSNVDISIKSFYDDVIVPMANMFAEAWTIGMGFNKQRKYICASYEHIDVLQENKKLKAEVDKITADTALLLYKEGMITKNERNGMLAIQPVAGGDTYAFDESNNEPIANKLLVGTLTELMGVIKDPSMSPDTKYIVLVDLYGIPKKVAKSLTEAARQAKEEADAKAAELLTNQNPNNNGDNDSIKK